MKVDGHLRYEYNEISIRMGGRWAESGRDAIQQEVNHVLYYLYWVVQVGLAFVMLATMSPYLDIGEFCVLLITIVILALNPFGE
jgi:hypothetical protein